MKPVIGMQRGLALQVAFFTVIGLLTNSALYGLYLGLTYLEVAPLAAMSTAYVIGVALSFTLNGRITFAGRPAARLILLRFIAAYGFGYLFNATGLVLAVDWLNVAHYWAQLFMIGATAVFLFILQRWWVFNSFADKSTVALSSRT